MMKYLAFSVLLFFGCASDYKGMQRHPTSACKAEELKPSGIMTNWYDASIDVMGKHLSGLLLIKQMPDESYRLVFTNEAGITFFDLEFAGQGAFKVHRMMKQMDKKPVINLLRSDFSLLLGVPFREENYSASVLNAEIYFGVRQKNETAYFITDMDCASLRRLEIGSDRKRKVSIVLTGNIDHPETVVIRHHTFDMVMNLKKIMKE